MKQVSVASVEHLSHKYASSWAVKDISFEIQKTGIVGLLGANGAGKSTTMNILCGVLNQTMGRVKIGGIDMREAPIEAKKQIGFLPQTAPVYMDFTVDEYLRYAARLRGILKTDLKRAVEEAKERCGITHFSKRLIKNLSGGYRQRVGIAQAIIHKPKLVVLDEPTNGLDPNQIIEVRSLIRSIAKEHAVIFSSHILHEVQLLCEDIKMIDGGKVVFADSIEAFNNYVAPHSLIIGLSKAPPVSELSLIQGIDQVELLSKNKFRLSFTDVSMVAEQVAKVAVENGWGLNELYLEKTSLDEIFAQLSAHKRSLQAE